jgi:hypothetical protein
MKAVATEIFGVCNRYLNSCENKGLACQENIGIMYISLLQDFRAKTDEYASRNEMCQECRLLKRIAGELIVKFRRKLNIRYGTDSLQESTVIGGKRYYKTKRYKKYRHYKKSRRLRK